MFFGIKASTFTIKFQVFQEIFFQKFFTLNFVPGFVEAGIFKLAFSQLYPVTSILHHKIKSKIGIS
jgi:hypothetical protein